MQQFKRSDRYSLALIAGVATAVLLMFLAVPVLKVIYSSWGMKSFDQTAVGPQVLELLAWMVAAFGGGFVAARIGKDYPLLFCSIIAAVLCYPLTMNVLAVHRRPEWFVIACVSGMPVAVIAAWRMARLFRQEPAVFAGGKT